MPLLEIQDLKVEFSSRNGTVKAVNGVSLSIEKGQVLALLGESGSGKSVTLRAIVRVLPKRSARISGRILFKGTDLLSLPENQLDGFRGSVISMIFQEPAAALDPIYTIGNQIVEVLQKHRNFPLQEARARATELLEMVQVPAAAHRSGSYPFELSGGMQQRAMIAQVLACDPEIILADEPTTSVDVSIQAQILWLLKNLQADLGIAVILVTHDIGVVAEIADQVGVMYGGRIVEFGPVRDVLKSPAHPYTEGLLRSTTQHMQRGVRLIPIPGQPPNPTSLPGGCSFAPRCQYVYERCPEAVPGAYPISSAHWARCFLRDPEA